MKMGNNVQVFEFMNTVSFRNERTLCIKNVFTDKKLAFMKSVPGI